MPSQASSGEVNYESCDYVCYHIPFPESQSFYNFFSSKQKGTTFLDIKDNVRASLVAQWLRICLPMRGTRVRALVWEDPTCHGATGPVSHNY